MAPQYAGCICAFSAAMARGSWPVPYLDTTRAAADPRADRTVRMRPPVKRWANPAKKAMTPSASARVKDDCGGIACKGGTPIPSGTSMCAPRANCIPVSSAIRTPLQEMIVKGKKNRSDPSSNAPWLQITFAVMARPFETWSLYKRRTFEQRRGKRDEASAVLFHVCYPVVDA